MIQELVAGAQAGNEAAWNALYRQYYPDLYATALRICQTIPFAEDAVQDAFIIAFLKLPQLKDAAAFGGWIKKILIHTCYRASRHYKANVSLDGMSRQTDSWWADELKNKMDSLSTQSSLYAALARLPEALRSAVLLRYFSHFQSYEAIASVLSIPVGTVRSRLNQAKLKLAKQWQEYDADTKTFKEAEAWNSFYYNTLSGMHRHNDCKNRMVTHLQKDVCLVTPGGELRNGNTLFDRMITEDREAGSWLTPLQVTSCGNISVIETRHYNSSEYPDHCPTRSVMVLYRKEGKVSRINLHITQ